MNTARYDLGMLDRLPFRAALVVGWMSLAACNNAAEVQPGVYTVVRATRNEGDCLGEGPDRDPMPHFIRIARPTDSEYDFGECDEATCLEPLETWVPEERILAENSTAQNWAGERSSCVVEGSFSHVTRVHTTLLPDGDSIHVERHTTDGLTPESCADAIAHDLRFQCIRYDVWTARIY